MSSIFIKAKRYCISKLIHYQLFFKMHQYRNINCCFYQSFMMSSHTRQMMSNKFGTSSVIIDQNNYFIAKPTPAIIVIGKNMIASTVQIPSNSSKAILRDSPSIPARMDMMNQKMAKATMAKHTNGTKMRAQTITKGTFLIHLQASLSQHSHLQLTIVSKQSPIQLQVT